MIWVCSCQGCLDELVEGFATVGDVKLYAEYVERNLGAPLAMYFDEVFLCGQGELCAGGFAGAGEFVKVAGEVVMVVVVEPCGGDVGAEADDGLEKCFGAADSAKEEYFATGELVEGFFALLGGLECEWAVDGFDDWPTAGEFGEFAGELFESGGGHCVCVGDDERVGVAEGCEWFAEESGGECAASAEGSDCADEHQVEIARETDVLEAVVEDDAVGAVGDGFGAAAVSVGVGEVLDIGEVLFEEKSFVVAESARGAGWAAVVASAEDDGRAACLFEAAGEPFDEWGFAGAAGGYVADADDWGLKFAPGQEADGAGAAAERCSDGINP